MNKKGLEFLKQRTENPIHYIELLKQDIVPPIFLLYLKHYKVGESFLNTMYIHHKGNDRVLNHLIMFDNEIINGEEYYATIDYIFEYERILEEIEKYKRKDENWNRLGFVQIGLIHWSDVLLIGVEEHNMDEIWRYGQGMGIVTCKLDNNIFDFFSRLQVSVDEETLEELGITDITKLYRNWGEDFWRVREEEA